MNQMGVLLKKEWRENIRNYKILWLPIVFILFGILEPVSNYFMPQILDSVGNLPEGAVIEFPEPTPEQLMAAVMGQYQLIGLLVLVLAYVGSVAGERRSGTATLLYIRPLSFSSYFISKWMMASLIAIASVWLGFLAAYYYTMLLYSPVDFFNFLQFVSSYSVWIVLIVSVVLAASAALPNTGLAAAASLALIFILQIFDGLVGTYWTISPLKIPVYATGWLTGGPELSHFWWSMAIAGGLIIMLVLSGIWMSEKNASKAKV
ncbi:ABC transporter permease [Planococcus sp. YIM B11945]|uniref:ABC transporter permease n=1 Tax=Planococcus sp. YIM B11945 TaxID=3435410 RepID=UPI003D7C7AEB